MNEGYHKRSYDKRILHGRTLEIRVLEGVMHYNDHYLRRIVILGEDVDTHETYVLDEMYIRKE